MKAEAPRARPGHDSYMLHRRQHWAQIVLPIVVGGIIFFVAPVVGWLTAMRGTGDVARWAAISTMWILIPPMVAGLILLVVLIALVVVTGRVTSWIPQYSMRAQRVAKRVAGGTGRAAEIIHRPVLAVKGLGSWARTGLRRLRERV